MLFRKKIDDLNNSYSLISPITITLGDEFQGIVESLEQGITIIFDLERVLSSEDYPFQLRYALGYGHILTPINSEIAHLFCVSPKIVFNFRTIIVKQFLSYKVQFS